MPLPSDYSLEVTNEFRSLGFVYQVCSVTRLAYCLFHTLGLLPLSVAFYCNDRTGADTYWLSINLHAQVKSTVDGIQYVTVILQACMQCASFHRHDCPYLSGYLSKKQTKKTMWGVTTWIKGNIGRFLLSVQFLFELLTPHALHWEVTVKHHSR